jgi:hypothetical protein
MYIYSTNQSLWLDRQNKKCTVYPFITGLQETFGRDLDFYEE